MKWKIYYSDGTSYSDIDGSPFDAPARDVQVIAIEDSNVGKTFVGKEDMYWYKDGRWFGGDMFGLYDYLIDNGPRKVIFGRVLDNDNFKKIMKLAIEDNYLPTKSARVTGEITW